jgi:hypothetical protein
MLRQYTPPPRPSERETWVIAFVEELLVLRPYLSTKLATVIARQEHAGSVAPAIAALAYHKAHEPANPAPARKRVK